MEITKQTRKQITITQSVTLSQPQLEDLIREVCKMPLGTVDWHDSSYGGIMGVTVSQTHTEYEDDSE